MVIVGVQLACYVAMKYASLQIGHEHVTSVTQRNGPHCSSYCSMLMCRIALVPAPARQTLQACSNFERACLI